MLNLDQLDIDSTASLEEANHLLYRMGLTDGLPVVPPTRERVTAMGLNDVQGPLFEVGYVKLIIDGVLSTHTALMKAPMTVPMIVPCPPVSDAPPMNTAATA